MRMRKITQLVVWLSLSLFWLNSALALSDTLPQVDPEAVGLSSERLQRATDVLMKEVEDGEISGAVGIIVRHGKIAYLKSVGLMDIGDNKPMQTDTIFRIASMSKPITSVAMMMLYEKGHFLLEDPVSKFIPEFAESKVLVIDKAAENGYRLEPAKSEITIRHLLNHTSGLTYQFMGKPHIGKMYREAGLHDALGPMTGTLEEKIAVLGGMPLAHHPGEVWDYGMNTDVLGRLVEIISGMSFNKFLRERIFNPLGMNDTYFYLPDDKAERLASMYTKDSSGSLVELEAGPYERWGGITYFSADFPIADERTYFSGGSGLVSTAVDYARFAQMILNGGKLGDIRLLSRKTIELMTTNSIGEKTNYWQEHFGDKFGYGFSVRTIRGEHDQLESTGAYGWGGIFYTRFWIDPVEDMITIFLTQYDIDAQPQSARKFRVMAYQSIAD